MASTQGWSSRLRRPCRSDSTPTETQLLQQLHSVVTVDLCTSLEVANKNESNESQIVGRESNYSDDSCIDLTCDLEEDVVDLTSVNDTSVMVLGSQESNGRLQQRKRKRQTRPQQEQPNHTDDDSELPDVHLEFPVSSSASRTGSTSARCSSPVKKIFCPVCLDDHHTIQVTDRQLISTVCGHIFCKPCIQETIRARHCCPTCRKKLTKKSFHPIFI